MWTNEQILQALAELIEGYDQNIKQMETAQRSGAPATVFGGELGALVAVCSDIERLIGRATQRRPDVVGQWLETLREGGAADVGTH